MEGTRLMLRKLRELYELAGALMLFFVIIPAILCFLSYVVFSFANALREAF